MKRLLIISLAALLLMAPFAAFARPVAVFVGPRFGWGGWYNPYWGPYPYDYGYYAPTTGDVKFDTHVKDAEVYVDGAYAGTVGKLKTLHLRPGSYNIEVRAVGRTQFEKKVYVAAGKTLHLKPELNIQSQPQVQP